jgi:hypothetical protein
MKSAFTNTIRSSFCAEGVRGGTRLFLIEDGSSFLVTTKFQIVGRRADITKALSLFESTLVGRA